MTQLDFFVILAYFLALQVVGFAAGRRARDTKDFFSSRRTLPWWAVSASIVAAETSSLTFISIPGLAYTGNLGFMQMAFGYVIGRVAVALVFLPAYFQGNLETVYAFLEQRFSVRLRRLVAIIFQMTRLLGTGVRLYATALPLSLISGWSLSNAILVFTLLTIPYLMSGGIRAGVWVEFVQAAIYLAGAIVAVCVLGSTGMNFAQYPEKLQVLSSGFDDGWKSFFSEPFHLAAGLIGGALLAISSHGTDQLIVQKALACRNLRDAQKAMIVSGVLVDLQFLLFLFIGVGLFIFFQGKPFAKSDTIFPTFIIENLPPGVIGLMLAAIFATGQSTLSATVSSLASSTMLDLFPRLAAHDERKRLLLSRLVTVAWAGAIMLVSFLFTDEKNPVVIIALKLASITAGGIVGLYALGFTGARELPALVGFITAASGTSFLAIFTPLAWTWYVPVGVVLCLVAAAFYCLSAACCKSRS